MGENLTHIRVKKSDRELWKKYCESLGMGSPKLFNKILTSREIQLNERVARELKRKNNLSRRLGIL